MTVIEKKVQTWPVVEIFGPTIQGEGVDQGVVSHFIRFGGCDYRCTWCDTPYAVLPEEVRAGAEKLQVDEIITSLINLEDKSGTPAPWIILTGGNPALLDLGDLVHELHDCGYLVAVETQGSRWREWMKDLDRICVSPKGPSANIPQSKKAEAAICRFLNEGMEAKVMGDRPYEWLFLKVVCFTSADVDFAVLMRKLLSDSLLYLSAGNDAGRTVGNPTRRDDRGLAEVRRDLLDRAAWLVTEVFKRPELCSQDVIVQCQQHTLLWGNGRGF